MSHRWRYCGYCNTIVTVTELLIHRGAKSVKIATLLDKPQEDKSICSAYIGKTIPKAFVVGYGLDYDEKYRNLPFVGILDPKVYKIKNYNIWVKWENQRRWKKDYLMMIISALIILSVFFFLQSALSENL